MRRSRPTWHAVATAVVVSILAPPWLDAEAARAGVALGGAGWQVQFDGATSTLQCRHAATGLALKGRLSFDGRRDGRSEPWTVRPARDSVGGRLDLVDPRNDVQGYVTVSGDGGRLRIGVLPRPPHNDDGELRYEAETTLGPRAFACRTRVPTGGRVVQMASGAADSGLNDSLFEPARDLVLRFDGPAVALATRPGETPVFSVRLTAHPDQTGGAAMGLELVSDYYRARYIPQYRLIDRTRAPKAPSGWMSWNVYFDTAGERENLDEARVGARFLRPFGLEIWSIESWQENSPRLPVSDFHNLTLESSKTKFPHGMKWLAEQIRGLGFRPGIWTVPFGTGDRAYYEAHRGMFLHHPDGTPMRNWCGRYVLDPSRFLAAREWWKLVPDQTIIRNGEENGERRKVAVRAEDDNAAYVFFPVNEGASLRLGALRAAAAFPAAWLDPRDGHTESIGVLTEAMASNLKPPEGWEDAVLVIERVNRPAD